MKNYWVKFGCFLTGHNYQLLNNCSEASTRAVKKYLSAILIISIFWFVLGFIFFERYFKVGKVGSLIAGAIMVIIVIQIERQIILSPGKNKWGRVFRILIALVMAIIGSVITDQIIFKDDVDKHKVDKIQKEVNHTLPLKTAQIDSVIFNLENLIAKKELERASLIDDVNKQPFITTHSTQIINHPMRFTRKDGTIGDTIIPKKDYSSSQVANSKQELIPNLEKLITELRNQKSAKQAALLTIRQDLEDELKEKRGLSDELSILFEILFASPITFFVWFCFLLLFLAIELFVLMSKISDKENDYDKLLEYQTDMRIKIMQKLNVE